MVCIEEKETEELREAQSRSKQPKREVIQSSKNESSMKLNQSSWGLTQLMIQRLIFCRITSSLSSISFLTWKKISSLTYDIRISSQITKICSNGATGSISLATWESLINYPSIHPLSYQHSSILPDPPTEPVSPQTRIIPFSSGTCLLLPLPCRFAINPQLPSLVLMVMLVGRMRGSRGGEESEKVWVRRTNHPFSKLADRSDQA